MNMRLEKKAAKLIHFKNEAEKDRFLHLAHNLKIGFGMPIGESIIEGLEMLTEVKKSGHKSSKKV